MRTPQLPPSGDKKPVSGEAKRNLILLIVNTLLFFIVYRVLLHLADDAESAFWSFFVMILYMVLLLGFGMAYLAYNRFLSRKGLTVEDLNPEWSEEQKREFIADGEARLQKSKWMMLIILPLVLTFLFDTIDLFIIQGVLGK